MDDQRFAHVGRDPKFRSMPKKYKKVKIDKRFDAMFKDKRFKLKYTVDKRGRPVNLSSSEDLKRYYDADERSDDEAEKKDEDEDEEEEASEAEEAEEVEAADATSPPDAASDGDAADADDAADDDVSNTAASTGKAKPSVAKKAKKTKKASAKKTAAAATEPSDDAAEAAEAAQTTKKAAKKDKKKGAAAKGAEPEDVPVGEEVRGRLMDLAVDYARGGGVLLEDSSSDDESEPEEVEVEHDWAELDREAPRITDEETTARLALCNMDWDRIKAQDIMVLMTSFLPPGGVINDVTIYPSEFGKKQMAEEEERGPPQLFDAKEKAEDADSSEEDEPKNDAEATSHSQMEYVRRYQLSRLRFYYAVVSCDSRETAAKLYDECEGLEFESSASRVDLRFIPDDMTFDETPRERCTAVPEAGRYRPSQFVTTALQQRLVRFTWDETDADRQEVVRRAAAKGGEVDDADIRAYLADSSSDEQQEDEDAGSAEEDEAGGKEDEQAKIAKYRALLAEGSDAEDDKPNGDVEMEITWGGLDLKEKTEELVKKKMGQEKDTTPWEKYIDKQKTKKKAKSAAQKQAAKAAEASSDSDSDSDIPSDLADDPFFKEELDARPAEESKQKKKSKAGKGKKDEVAEPDEGEKAQLALLTMDDAEEDTRRHFNFKQIVKDEASAGKKRKWKKKRKPTEEEKAPAEDFQVDVADPRFSKLFESANFNVDPSDARYKPTAGMRRLVGEKQRRVVAGEDGSATQESAQKKARSTADQTPSAADELGALVNTIKSKTKQLKRKKAKSSR